MSDIQVSRRDFLKRTAVTLGAAAASSVLAACGGLPQLAQSNAPAAAKSAPKTLHIIQATGQNEAADSLVKQQTEAWGKANGFTVNLEIVDFRAIAAKTAAAMSVQSGPDIMLMQDNEVWINAHSLADVTPTVEKAKKELGGVYDLIDANCKVNGKYLAVPFMFFGQAWVYRSDWFGEVGYPKFPATMDELLDAATKLKAKNHPVGVSLASNNGDARAICYSILWNFGGKEVDETGNKVTINSPETVKALEWAKKFFDVCDPSGFAWDGGGNNRAYAAKTISATNNSASIYVTARDKDPELGKVTDNAISPKGPAGGWFYSPARQYAVAKWSPHQQAAQDLIWYLLQPAQFNAWLNAAAGFQNGAYHAYDEAKPFKDDPKLAPYQQVLTQGRWGGYAGAPNAKSAQVWNQDIIVNMFARVQQGTAIDQAIKAAETSMKQIYE